MSLIYLDHHSTTPVDPRVVDAMAPYWTLIPGNPASTSHRAGEAARKAIAEAREQIAACLMCHPEEIYFTSGATESNNLAIKGVMAGRPGGHQIVNAGEHRSVLDPARRLRGSGPVTVLPIDSAGRVEPVRVRDAITAETELVSVMWANNEVGSLNDIQAIGSLCREHYVRLHVDAAQALGKVPIDLSRDPVDLMSGTAHKLYGPKGIGLLFVRKSSTQRPLVPLIDGGGHERGLRSGTLPVPLIVGFAKALEVSMANREEEWTRLHNLRESLWHQIQQRIPVATRNTPVDNCLPGNLNVQFGQIDGELLLARLRQTELCVSSGSACTSANPEPSHVLRAMGLSDQAARASLRFGLGRFTTVEEIARAAEIVAICYSSSP